MLRVQEDLRQIQVLGERTVEQLPPPGALDPLRRRGIAGIGLSQTQVGFSFARHAPWHDTLLVTAAGSGEVWDGESWRAAPHGTSYWAPAGIPHAYRCPAGGHWNLGWVTTWPSSLGLRLAELGEQPGLAAIDAADLMTYVQQYCTEAAADDARPALEPLAELIALALARLTTMPRRLDALWGYVDARLDAPWTLTRLARLAGLSGEQLRAVCIRERGESPVRHLTRRRMMRAATLLLSTDNTVERVGRAVGYQNPFAFSAAFRRWSGSPPSVFRQIGGRT